MKNILGAVAVALMLTIGFTSCNPNGSGEGRYTYLRGKQGVLVMDSETGKVYRMKIAQDGSTTWDYLGSPEDAK